MKPPFITHPSVFIHLQPNQTLFSKINMYTRERLTLTSCFSSSNPKFLPRISHRDSADGKPSQFHSFDDYYITNQEVVNGSEDTTLVKSKSRALKIYNKFKKVKQLISPLGRVTSFITSLFTPGHVKKIKEEDVHGVDKTVHCYPVSIVVDEDSSHCVQKSLHNEEFQFDRLERQRQSYQISETLKSHFLEMYKNIDQGARDVFLKWLLFQEKDDDAGLDHQEDEDAYPVDINFVESNSYCEDEVQNDQDFDTHEDAYIDRVFSSDLFEIDIRTVFETKGFCEDKSKYDHLEEQKISGFFEEGVGCFSERSSDLFEIDHPGVFGYNVVCEEDDDFVSNSLTIRHHEVNDSPNLTSWVPQNFKNVIVELERVTVGPEPILVVSKRFLPSEIESGQNRFKIPRLCF